VRTYVDSGVLIAAARGKGALSDRALAIISDFSREFVCSDYVRLEVIPKPTYFGYAAEVEFYQAYFANIETWLGFEVDHLRAAFEEACRAGLSAIDAIHVVVAAQSGCEEFITTEKPTKAIHRTSLLRIVSIDSGDP
jgi:predicted nucleic acid-binding protein